MVTKAGEGIRSQAIELLKRSDQLSAKQIEKHVNAKAAKITRILLSTPEVYFNGLMFEYLPPSDPRRTALTIYDALNSKKWRPTFLGQRIMHSWVEIAFLEQLLNHYRFNNLIELGTASGGLTTLFMLHALKTKAKIISVDIGEEPTTEPYKTLAGLTEYLFIKGDAIHPTKKNENIIKSAIQSDGRTLIYCDANGYKDARIDQMNRWVPYMKNGDVVISHDYPTQITEEQVQSLIDEYDLTPFHQEEAWKMGCGLLTYERSENHVVITAFADTGTYE